MEEASSGTLTEYYETLGLGIGATASEVRKSARRLLMINHPDLNPGGGPECEEATRRINEAYAALMKVAPGEGGSEAGAPEERSPAVREALVFTLSGRALAIPGVSVRGVVRMKDVRIEELGVAACALPHMVGVFNHGGEMSILWNLQTQLGLRETPVGSDVGRRRIVLVEAGASSIGFIADDVLGIIEFDAWAAMPADDPEVDARFISGAGAADGLPVLMLDVDAVVS